MGGPDPRRPHALPLLALVALAALVAARGDAAPLQPGGSPALTKIYPRGSHWAVGHLMGKKSAEDFPYVDEEENKISLSVSPENTKQLKDYLQREEIYKILKRMEGNENKNAHVLKRGLPWYTKSAWEMDGGSNKEDVSLQ
uniref:Gastrin-releasing peptide n=1 Tax=Nothoprocta perdicaria TaxID=30464 RepID=A0A8C6YWL9_NOTPE